MVTLGGMLYHVVTFHNVTLDGSTRTRKLIIHHAVIFANVCLNVTA